MNEVTEKKPRVPKEPIVALDALGQEITLDAVVAAPQSRSSLFIGRVSKISPKMIEVRELGAKSGTRKFHNEIVVIGNSPAATMYVLVHDR